MPDRGCTRVVRAGVAVACRCCRRRRAAAIRAARGESRPCSYAKVLQHVAIAIQFDNVVKLREHDYGHRLCKCVGEFQREANVSVFHQVEVESGEGREEEGRRPYKWPQQSTV